MKLLFAILATMLLAGCSTLGPSAEQIKEMKGTSSSMCVDAGPTIYSGAISVHYSSFGGNSVGTAGGGGKAACGKSIVDFQNEGKLQLVNTLAATAAIGAPVTLPVGTMLQAQGNGTFVVVPKPAQ